MELKKYKLSDLCIPNKIGIYGVPASAEDFSEDKIRYLRISDISDDGLLLDNDKKSVTDKDIEKYILEENDIVFARTGNSTGRAYLYDSNDGILAFAGFLIKYQLDSTKVNPRFVRYFTISEYYKQWVKNLSVGSTRGNISAQTFADCPIILPSRRQQDDLAFILHLIDRKIALNRAINRNLEALAKQLYDYWFVQFDFPDENGRPYKSSGGKMVWNEVLKREVPEGWKAKTVNDVSSICRGVSYKPNDLQESGVLILRGNNIENNHIVYDNNTAYLLPNMISDEQKIKKHDIIITMSSGSKEHIGKCAMFQKDSEHSFGAFLSKITPMKECPYFLFLYLSSSYFKQKIKSICNGTGINNLTNQTFDEVKFAYPAKGVLLSFERSLQPIFDMIGINESEINTLTRKRDELLPLLMNGQVTIEN